jgi:L-iditol 2-dehydrogenase
VIAADTIGFRTKKAVEMGAHEIFEADESLIPAVREANRGYLADLVVLCYEGFIPLALRTVERGGTVLFFAGAAEGATLPVPINDLFWRTEISLTSTYAGSPADCIRALKLIHGGSVPVSRLITHRLGMAEACGAFHAVSSPKEHDCIKVVVEPQR